MMTILKWASIHIRGAIQMTADGQERGYICDPEKNTKCDKRHCWINGGECKMTLFLEFATDGERDKYPNDIEGLDYDPYLGRFNDC